MEHRELLPHLTGADANGPSRLRSFFGVDRSSMELRITELLVTNGEARKFTRNFGLPNLPKIIMGPPPPARRAVRGRLRRDARRAGVTVRELLAAREAVEKLRTEAVLPKFDFPATWSGRISSAHPNVQNVPRTP